MFKSFFLELVNTNSCISLYYLQHPALENTFKLNWTTVRIYHQLYGTGK